MVRGLILAIAFAGFVGPGAAWGQANTFTYTIQNDEFGDAYFQQISWINSAGTTKRVSWDEQGRYGPAWVRSYLHSYRPGVGTGSGWTFVLNDGTPGAEMHAAIDYTVLAQSPTSVTMRAQASTLTVTDTIVFAGDAMTIDVAIENKLAQNITVEVPVYFNSLQVGNISSSGLSLADSHLTLLRPGLGGYLHHGWAETGGVASSYPEDIGGFSPVMALYDENISMGIQFLTRIEMPSNVKFIPFPRYQFNPTILTFIKTPLTALQTKTFRVALKLADGNDWKSALQPYKAWFQSQYGTVPQYCPSEPFAYFVGSNAQCWSSPRVYNPGPLTDDGSGPNACYDAGYPAHRFYTGTQFLNVYGKALPNISAINLKHYGVWSATLYSGNLSVDCNTCLTCAAGSCPPMCASMSCEFAPNAELMDPALDVGASPAAIASSEAAFESAGAHLFWYMRSCSNINGADILNPGSGTPTFVPGTYVEQLDLRQPAVRDLQFAKFDFLAQHGIREFYIDFITCPGESEFIDYVKSELRNRYGFTPLIIREGARDRDVIKNPGVPILKLPNYVPEHSQLANWLVPDATLYGGYFNSQLSVPELEDVISRGYQPVLSGSLMDTNPSTIADWKRWSCSAYVTRVLRQDSYGSALGCPAVSRPSYCPVYTAPDNKLPVDSIKEAYAFPNPAKSDVTFKVLSVGAVHNGKIVVYNLIGERLASVSLGESASQGALWLTQVQWRATSLPSGVYVFNVQADGLKTRAGGKFAVIR